MKIRKSPRTPGCVSEPEKFIPTQLRSSWNVTVDGSSVRHNRLPQNLGPHLAALEAGGVDSYDGWGRGQRLSETMPDVVGALAALRVVRAYVLPIKDRSVRRIFI
jgi:hypothetical protein